MAGRRTTAPDPSLFEAAAPGETAESAITVATLTAAAKDVVEGAFPPVWLRGEVSDFKAHRNGHWYFALRDADAQIRCVIWSRETRRIPAPPDDGMQVFALGQLTVWPVRGDLQFSIRQLEAAGDGLWQKALEATRARLQADGLLDPSRRRPIPSYPRCVAMITSPDGAAWHDVVSVIRRRAPDLPLVLVPAKVQGEGSAESLIAALDRVVRWGGADTIIIGRGGGAREDLWAFNDEALARAIAASPVPIISAVGHEVDVTICDLVADLRAATPSAAAEAASPDREGMALRIRGLAQSMARLVARRTARVQQRVQVADDRARRAMQRVIERRRARLATLSGQLDALSPLAVLGRGYAVARDPDGRTLQRMADFPTGQSFDLWLADGIVAAKASGTRERP
jgi:exodeoxyribonuclease VII large subunit